MKKVIVSLASLVISLVLCGTARAQAHRNAYGGGSTYHSGNSTTRTNAYGGSATHTAGQGTTATNAYGGSAYHAQGSGKTTATNAYGGSATHTAGQGTTATNAYGGSAYHAEGSGTTTATNAYGGSATHYAGYGTVATSSSGQTASAYHPPTAYYGYHPPTTAAYYGTSVLQLYLRLDCRCRSRRRCSRHGRWRRRSLFQGQRPKAQAPTMQATQPARQTRALPTPTLPLRMPMRRQPTPMRRPRTPMPPLPMRVAAAPTSRIRWAQFMGRYLPAASVPRSQAVEPIICAATPGSVRPMVRMVSFTAWCPHRKGKVHRSNGTAFMWKKIEKTEEIS